VPYGPASEGGISELSTGDFESQLEIDPSYRIVIYTNLPKLHSVRYLSVCCFSWPISHSRRWKRKIQGLVADFLQLGAMLLIVCLIIFLRIEVAPSVK
jgi:hypothetical protein